MKTYLDCYPCFLRQALDAARFAGAGEQQQTVVLRDTLATLHSLDPTTTPPEIGDRIHRQVRSMVASRDPYRDVKRAATAQALDLLPWMRETIRCADDPLDTAIRLAIAGNIIDYGHNPDYDLDATIDQALHQPIGIDDASDLRGALAETRVDRTSVLYLADNAGETVFDRALIELLDPEVTYAIKGGPVLNDATAADALQAGLDSVATVVSTGADTPGTILHRTSPAFRDLYAQATLIVAKGQANYETLSPGDDRVFFLLKAKCPVIARDLGVEPGALIVKQGSRA